MNAARWIAIAAAMIAVSQTYANDWTQFRGNDTTSVARRCNTPIDVADDGVVAWTADLDGRGLSGPIVVGEKVIVTSSSGAEQNRLHVDCFDFRTGKHLWKRESWALGRTMCHPKMCMATPTPASDGRYVFAFYSSNDVICLDLEGNMQWFRSLTKDFPNASNSLGMSSSPVVLDGTLVLQVESDAESFATGIDTKTGVARWKRTRPRRANWSSPTIVTSSVNQRYVLLQSSAGIEAVVPKTGEVLWKYEGGASTIPSSAVFHGRVFVPSNGITVLDPKPAGLKPEIAWNDGRLSPATSSPVALGDDLFTLNRVGIMKCVDTRDAELKWQTRLKGPFSATPVLGNDHLYVFNEEGLLQVVSRKGGDIVSEREFEDTILCSPAIAHDSILIRSDKHLWRLANSDK